MKKRIWVGLAAVIVLICVSIASKAFFDKSQQYKDFTSHIDLLMEAYRSAKSATDPDDKRRSVNMMYLKHIRTQTIQSGCPAILLKTHQEESLRISILSYKNTTRSTQTIQYKSPMMHSGSMIELSRPHLEGGFSLRLADLLLAPRDVEVSVLVLVTRHKQTHQIIVHSKTIVYLVQVYVLPLHKQIQFLFC